MASGLQLNLNRVIGRTDPSTFLDAQGAANAWTKIPPHGTVHAATTSTTSGAYVAGTTGADGGTGVGATITAPANAALVVDSRTMAVGDRVLYWKNTDAKTNGIYTVTDAGSASTKWVITRAVDHNNGTNAGQVGKGDWVTIDIGPVNGGKTFYISNVGTGVNGDIVIGTDNIVYTEITAPVAPGNLDIIGALNFKLDPLLRPDEYEELNGVCNELAGTTNLDADGASEFFLKGV